MKVLSEHCANNDTQIIQMRLDKMATFCYMVGDKSSKTYGNPPDKHTQPCGSYSRKCFNNI